MNLHSKTCSKLSGKISISFLKSSSFLIFIIPFISSIYFGWTVPVSIDEAYTFLEFTRKSFFYAISHYPAPNNHVLHSIFTQLTKDFFPYNLLFSIRFSVILASILTWIVAFLFFKKYYGEKVSLFITAISSMLFMSIYYSFMSRGYMLVLLLFVIAFYASYNIIKGDNKKKDWVVFSVASVFGFYTMPSFLYAFLTLNLFIFVFKLRGYKSQIFFNLAILVFVLILYFPIIFNEGIGVLANNSYVSPKDRVWVLTNLYKFGAKTVQEIFGVPFFIIIPPIIIAFLYALKMRDKWVLSQWLIWSISPIVLLMLHSVIPFPRTFFYYGLIIIYLIAISIEKYINKVPKYLLLIVLLSFQCVAMWNFYREIGNYESFNTYYKEINDKIIEKGKSYYMINSYNNVNHQFEMIVKGCDPSNAVYDYNVNKASADTINDYDYVIISISKDKTKYKKPIFSNKEQNVYGQE